MNIFNISEVAPQIPNLLFRGRMKFMFESLPFEAKNISWKKRLNFFVAGLNQYLLPEKPVGYPVIAQVEPSNVCNLECSLCLTASINHERQLALLSLDTFKKFIDEVGDYLLLIIFWNWGEPFLNPNAPEMIKYATDKGILIHSSTNGNIQFSTEMADRIVRSNLTSLIIAVDGATQESYAEYRIGGKLELVKKNIVLLQETKKRLGSIYPRITVRFVAMQHNEIELKKVEELAKNLGADFFATKTVDMPVPIGEHLDEKYRPDEENLRRYEYIPGTYERKEQPFTCMRPWKRITLDSSGEVISCEYDYKNALSFGNISNKESVMRIWKSKKSQAFRRGFNLGNNEYYHCKDCTYKNLVGSDCIIEAHSIKQVSDDEY